jgi:RNA polymerase sigma-70 factor (ECF subfamily)
VTHEPSVHAAQIEGWLKRLRAGDHSAREEMLRSVCARLEQLAHKMLRRFGNVRRWVDTEDVLQSALLRLWRTLQQIDPESVRDFYNLAAVHLRRELLDLARYYARREAAGLYPAHAQPARDADSGPWDPADAADDPAEVERWCAFHREVERLRVSERELVGLVFYHGWTQAEVAELFDISERTVRRRWESALEKLHHLLEDHPPGT